MIRKNISKTIALSVALTTIIGGSGIASAVEDPVEKLYPTAEERDVDNIYPSDTETEDSWKWGEWLYCEDIMDEDFQDKLKEVGDVNTVIANDNNYLQADQQMEQEIVKALEYAEMSKKYSKH